MGFTRVIFTYRRSSRWKPPITNHAVNLPQRPALPICTHHDNSLSSSCWTSNGRPPSNEPLDVPTSAHKGDHAPCGDVRKLHWEEDLSPKILLKSSFYQKQCCVTMAWSFSPSCSFLSPPQTIPAWPRTMGEPYRSCGKSNAHATAIGRSSCSKIR